MLIAYSIYKKKLVRKFVMLDFLNHLPRVDTDVGLTLGRINLVTREGANLKPLKKQKKKYPC